MSKFKEKKEEKGLEVLKSDYDKLRAGFSKFKQVRIGGVLYAPFEQYMQSIGVCFIDERQGVVILDPAMYAFWSKVRSKMEAYDYYRFEETLQQFPEEKKIHFEKVKNFIQQVKKLITLRTVKRGVKIT